jgi:hypothetical protein
MGWCYGVILIEFCLAPLFACFDFILIIGRVRKELLMHLSASLPFLWKFFFSSLSLIGRVVHFAPLYKACIPKLTTKASWPGCCFISVSSDVLMHFIFLKHSVDQTFVLMHWFGIFV